MVSYNEWDRNHITPVPTGLWLDGMSLWRSSTPVTAMFFLINWKIIAFWSFMFLIWYSGSYYLEMFSCWCKPKVW